MKLETGKVQMAKLDRIFHKLAERRAEESELFAELSAIFHQLAEGETVDLRTGKQRARYREPVLPTIISDEDRVRAVEALRHNEMRRRGGR